jgi:DNA helicase-2/ATP-dependent DNA helicase PcrA
MFLQFDNLFGNRGGQSFGKDDAPRTGTMTGLPKKVLALQKPTPKPATPINPDFVADDTSGLKVSDKVAHQRFGDGEVVLMEGIGDNKKATIDFTEHGRKVLVLKFAKLQIK